MSRLTGSRILIVVGTVLAALSILAVWISRQVLETDQWTETSSQLLEQKSVQVQVAGFLVDQLYANVDVQGELAAALPGRFAVLAGPAAGAIRQGADQIARRALSEPKVQGLWEDANRTAHGTLVDLVVNGGGSVVAQENGVVTLDLKALLTDLAERTGVGGRVADRLPEDAATLEVLRSDELSTAQTVAKALKPLALVLVLLTLACYGAAITLARGHRREMVRAAGLSFIFAGAFALVVRRLVGNAVVDDMARTEAVKPAIEDTWDIATSFLVGVAGATIAYGVLAVLGAWLAGPTHLAVRARTAMAPWLRKPEVTYAAVAGIVLLVLAWGPTEGTRRPLPALVLTILFVIGVEALRRQVIRDVPPPPDDPAAGVEPPTAEDPGATKPPALLKT